MRFWRSVVVASVALLAACGSRTSLDDARPPSAPVTPPPSCPGGGERALVEGLPFAPSALLVIGPWLYFGGSTYPRLSPTALPMGGLYRVPRAGGAYELVTADFAGGALVTDGRFLYYPKAVWIPNSSWGGGYFTLLQPNIVALPLDGGAPIDVPTPAPVLGVEFPRANGRPGVYWISIRADRSSVVEHWDTHTSRTIVTDVVGDYHSFLATPSALYFFDEGGLVRTDLDGSGAQRFGNDYTMLVQNVGDTVYAADDRDTGNISILPFHATNHILAPTPLGVGRRDPTNMFAVADGVAYYLYNGLFIHKELADCEASPDCRRFYPFGDAPTSTLAVTVSECDVYWSGSDDLIDPPGRVLTRSR